MIWLPRPKEYFQSERGWKIWTSRFLGKEVGSAHGAGYRETSIKGVKYLLHRLIWFYMHGEWPERIDHQDHNKSNNRLENLVACSHQQNMKNMKRHSSNKSGVSGVHRHSQNDSWVAQIWNKNKAIHIGSFSTFEEAVKARKQAEMEYSYHENHGKG